MCMQDKIDKWVRQLNKRVVISSDIIALNFGLFETTDGYCIYLSGSKQYDENDDDWACNTDYKSDYLLISNEECHEVDWKSFLNETTTIVIHALNNISSNDSIFSNRVITIGFDDGNLNRIR